MPDLDLFRSFLAIYRAGSITRAARTVRLTQPALSAHLRALEAAVGRPLFTRRARGVTPTPAGDDLARLAAGHVEGLEAVVESMRAAPGLAQGTLYLGGPGEFTTARILPRLAPLVSQGLALRVTFDLAASLLEKLSAGELDLVVATKRIGSRGLAYRRLFVERFALVGAPAWTKAVSPRALALGDLGSLAGVPLLAYTDDLPIIRRFFGVMTGARFRRAAQAVVPDLRALLALSIAGAGMTVLPRYLCDEPLKNGALVELATAPRPVENTLYLASRAGRVTPLVSQIMDRLAPPDELL
jgi:DNA-binding transcriptional LysR family regulator